MLWEHYVIEDVIEEYLVAWENVHSDLLSQI